MTDQRFEQLLHDILDAETPMRAPERLVPETQRAVRRVRRRPAWLATILERPMRVSRRVVVGSPVQRSLAIGVALLLLALLTVGTLFVGAQLLLPRTIVVDPSGNGDAITVTEGIEMADDGDSVLLRAGEYVEDVVIDKRITLRGDEPSGSATIRFTLESPPVAEYSTALRERYLYEGARRLTLGGEVPETNLFNQPLKTPRGLLVVADGSAIKDVVIAGPVEGLGLRLRAENVTLANVEVDFDGTGDRDVIAVVADGGDITIADSSFDGDLLLGGDGTKELLRNAIAGEIGILDVDALLVGNTIRMGPQQGSGVTVQGNSEVIIDDNDIQVYGRGIYLDGSGVRGTVTQNVVIGGEAGLYLEGGAVATAEENRFAESDMGIRSTSAGTSVLRDNTVQDNGVGIILSAGSTEVSENRVIGNRNQGIGVLGDASPVVIDNELCANGTDLFVAETATAETSGNEICPVAE